jgi:hypothetical protein
MPQLLLLLLLMIAAGTRMHLFMWARTPAADSQVNLEFMLLDSADQKTGYKFEDYSITAGVVTPKYEQFPMVGFVIYIESSYMWVQSPS